MPNPTEIFATRDLIEGMEASTPPSTFLNSTFFPKTSFFVGRFCQVDSRKARQLLAPVVKYGQPGRVVAREPVTTKFFEVPEVKPMRVTLVTDLDVRAFGESVYSKKTPQERYTDLVVKDLLDLTHSATRRIEQMTSSLLFTGAFSYRLDSGETETLDYGTVTPIVPSTKWDAADSDPLGDLQTAVNQIVAASGLMPDVLVLGSNVMSVFLSHSQVIDVLNKLNVSLGAIHPSKPTLGTAQFVGRVYRPYIDLYGYAESYELEETPGTLQPMVPEDSALLGCSTSQATTSYGSVTQTESDGQIATYTDVKFVPRQLSEPRQEYHELRIATRPCLIPFDLSSWAVINPLT
jgi:hypothetical protein